MNQWYRLWLCAGVLALGTSSAGAHTSKVCWRAEADGTVTMFAGLYHDVPGLFGGLVIDGIQHDFIDSIPELPPDVLNCQADCAPSPPIVKWQTVNVALPPGLHTMTTTSTSGNEVPLPGCFPATFGTGAPIPTAMAYTGGTSTDPGVPVTVAAIMTPVVIGAPVVFTLDGGETCAALVDAQGIASCAIAPAGPGGVYPLTASFPGSGAIQPSSVTIPFTVLGAPPPPPPAAATTLVYAGDTHVAGAEPARLAGVLREGGLAPIAGRTVHFTLGAGPAAQGCSGVTDASGTASCTIDAVAPPLGGAAAAAISASFAGDASYLPSSAAAEALVQHMTGEAYAIAGSARLLYTTIAIPRTPDTGPASTAHASTTATPCAAAVSAKMFGLEVLGAKQLCANVTTTLAPGASSSHASIERATIAFGGILPAIRLDGIEAYAESGCGGASGQVTIGSISIGGLTFPIGAIAPNTTIGLPFGGRITFNEQLAAAEADHGLTVRGIHIVVPPVLGLAELDLVLASATSAVHDCRPTASPLVPFVGPGGEGPGGEGGEEIDDADVLDPAGGCRSTHPGGAAWPAAIALLATRRRRRAPARGWS